MVRAVASPAQNPQQRLSVVEINALKFRMVADRLNILLSSGVSSAELFKLCLSLARGIDYALSKNDTPQTAFQLPPLVKRVYQHRNDATLQSAIALLMIAVKSACQSRWFPNADSDELLKMANELLGSFCSGIKITTEADIARNTILKIIPRFCPQLRLGQLLVSFEVKPGYGVLMSDFHIKRSTAQGESIRLFVAQTNDQETSSCLENPLEVSFLVNGVGVAGRTNVFLDKGPQLPTDITKMLKHGTNIIQASGYFKGSYIIAVAFMSKEIDFLGSDLKEYVQPAITATDTGDPEIIEGSSRISLNCPISLSRIRTPVKGYLCRHHQCFDYDNFLEINSKRPLWHCPCCNQPSSFIDLRIDQNMVKILKDMTVDTTYVVISADGLWKAVLDHDQSAVSLPNATLVEQTDQGKGDESNGKLQNAVDLTMEEDEGGNNSEAYEIGYRKSLKKFQPTPVPQSSSVSLGSSVIAPTLDNRRVGTLESLIPTCILNPASFNIACNLPPVSYQANPSTIQALPTSAEASISSEWVHSYLTNSDSCTSRGFPTLSHQTVSPLANMAGGGIDMQQISSPLDINPPVQQFHPMIQIQDQGCQLPFISTLQQIQGQGCQFSSISASQRSTELSTSPQIRALSPVALQNISVCNTPQHPVNIRGCTSSTHSPTQNVAGIPLPNFANPYIRVLASEIVAGNGRFPSVQPHPSTVQNNWQPMGRMRGSLSGNEYSAAINRYVLNPSLNSVATSEESLASNNSNTPNLHSSSVWLPPWSNLGSEERTRAEKVIFSFPLFEA
ncbi:uncharacterized protein A4U43_C05F6500 [Asparagus officinalis]|uniref:SP-RING-type domain-containing protein n=1 Tax=Asparagus officinalis TaxID=4686 RepID=A0A5P1EQF3_ASPOF|nr:E4 SUMO-protein ligase PIAL2-like isoform X2 [Asparagus officinalis]ONK68034.1 uncharacterized protein A4U43_C05F6500 [Asparagus officinalis]